MNEAIGFNARIIEVVREKFPKFHIKAKEDVWFQRLLSYLMFWMWRWPKGEDGKRRWTSLYMTNYTTTMGYGMYVTSLDVLQRRRYWWTIAHEFVHMWDMNRITSIPYSLAYGFPQILVPGALLAIGAIWWPQMIWCLLFLVFALPLPSPGRMWLEWRGYTMTLACEFWDKGEVGPSDLPWIIENFTGPDYFFMWPFKKHITRKFEDSLRRIRSGEILEDEPFRIVHDAYRDYEANR